MQSYSLRTESYYSWSNTGNAGEQAQRRYKALQIFEKLRQEGCFEATILGIIGISRATLYCRKKTYKEKGLQALKAKSTRPRLLHKSCWTKGLQQLVYQLRQKHPFWGKLKNTHLDHEGLSDKP